ncbi:hypothetical protein SAMN05660297_02285 [Natronincola peptidivorans]|uniref:Uncharacterized protein n=1 Tax=Natronincola peptidivorans TaxID=426128 RepID=A0A1I0E766_9FIRM|nr:hypothetical protein [Natronincola peptidivorans]SET40288.1 hypothetical protein SAMN05660297_02285 [Natronincola peptidivorans]
MKKVLTIICISLMLFSLIGCSQQASNQQSEEELRAEIRAEMEAQATKEAEEQAKNDDQKQSNNNAQQQANDQTNQSSNGSQGVTSQPVRDDLSKGFTYKVENGDLKLTYNNSDNTVTLINAYRNYNYRTYEKTGEFTHNMQFPEVTKAQLSDGGREIYFSVGPIHGVGILTFFIELDTMDIYLISQGTFVEEVRLDQYTTLVILQAGLDYTAHFPRGYGDFYPLGSQLERNRIAQFERAVKERENQSSSGAQGSSNQSSSGSLREFYELNKEYTLYNLNQDGNLDKFKLVRPNDNEIYFEVNGDRIEFRNLGNWSYFLDPPRISDRYTIIPDSEWPGYFVLAIDQHQYAYNSVFFFRYVIVPSGPFDVWFNVEPIGYYTGYLLLDEMNITDLDSSSVTINGERIPWKYD